MDETRERRRLIAAFKTGTDIAKLRDWAARYSVDRARILFEKKPHNPFHAWEAYRWARSNDRPVPDWVMNYLDGCAEALKKTQPKNATAVAQALGMAVKAGSSKVTLALCESDRLALFQGVMVIKEMKPDWLDQDIFGHIAVEHDVSINLVEAAYYEFRS